MLTIFTIPHPFTAATKLSQSNAIQSWSRLGNVQIILCGDDSGVAEAAAEFGCEYYPALRRTSLGTPRLDDAFHAAEHLAKHELLCFVNADVILLNGFQTAVSHLTDPEFMIAGRRMDVWLSTEIPFEHQDWDVALWEWAQREGRYATPDGSDYFIFRRGTLGEIPPFAVGRLYWDNWMMFRARQRGWPLIDGTHVIRAIHQNHEYGHVPDGARGIWEGPEAADNIRATGGHLYTLVDATHALEQNGYEPIVELEHRLRRMRRWLERLPGWRLARSAYRVIRRLSRRPSQV